MTRVLFLSADPGVPVLGHKGASVHVREMVLALSELGVEVHVASPRVQSEGETLTAEVALHALPAVLPKACTSSQLAEAVDAQEGALLALASELGVDALYERFSLYSAAGVRVARQLGLPHVLEVNAPLREEAARYRTLPHPRRAAALEQEVMERSDRVLAVSATLARTLIGEGLDEQKVEVVPNGVAAHRFAEPVRDPARFLVGFAGSLKPWHGVETLVEALLAVPEAHLEVAGHGPLEEALARLPARRVTRLGAVRHAEVLARISRWDAGLAPYAPVERFWFSPLKVLEYMAAGTCPVVSDIGDARDTLGDGERGILVAPGDAEALADALRGLATDRRRALSLGARARAWVREHRSWSVNAQRVLAALRVPAGAGAA
jgi:glycosyltransferase involved in cell wall biosynthesis